MDDRLTVMIVDDDPDLADVLEDALRELLGAGCGDVVHCRDGRSACDLAFRHRPHLVVLDTRTRYLQPWNVLNALEGGGSPPNAAVLVCSAVEQDLRSLSGWLSEHHGDAVSLPFELDELEWKVRRLLTEPTVSESRALRAW